MKYIIKEAIRKYKLKFTFQNGRWFKNKRKQMKTNSRSKLEKGGI